MIGRPHCLTVRPEWDAGVPVTDTSIADKPFCINLGDEPASTNQLVDMV
jgi:hypothetical protein